MARNPPVTDQERARVAQLHADGLNCRQIADEIGRARSTVSGIARALGLAFDRAQTETATTARQVDAKARRAQLADRALDTADEMERRALAADTGRDARDYAAAYGVFIDRHIRLSEVDADQQGLAAVDAWLRGITGT